MNTAPRNTRARWPSSASYAKLDTETGLPVPLWWYRDHDELSFYCGSQRDHAVFYKRLLSRKGPSLVGPSGGPYVDENGHA